MEVVIDPKDIELTSARSGGAGGYTKEIHFMFLSHFTCNNTEKRSWCRAKCEQGGDGYRSIPQTIRYTHFLYRRKDSD